MIDRTPGLVIVEVSRGSLRARLHGEFRKSPIATLAACVVLFGGVTTAIEFWSDEGRPTERCDIAITAPVSDEATNLSMDALAHLPAGCSVKIDLRATTPSGSQAGVSAWIESRPEPAPQTGHGEAGSLSTMVGHVPPRAQDVTYERILNARSEPHNWLTYYGAYDGQRYSPLDQINTKNVQRLSPAWVLQPSSIGMSSGASTYSFETAPIVVDGVMYITGWDGWVWALDARTGQELWRREVVTSYDVAPRLGTVNRGVAVAQGQVFVATPNAHVSALDAETGKVVWDQRYGDARAGESATLAPLIVKDMVIVGSSGGEFGVPDHIVRGHMDAFKLATGERVWRCYTVPKPGEPGSETWPAEGEAWAHGGANCWITCTYDPELNLLYQGTGKPVPEFEGEVREGDNLYTDCVIAVDADSGEIRWHYQYTPHDVWAYDSTMENILFELDGRKLLAHFDKNGYFFVLDRTNGELVRVVPFVDRITWGPIAANGKVTPRVYPAKEGDPVHYWPGPAGAKEWTHAAYSQKTELFYVPVRDVGATVVRRSTDSDPYRVAGVAADTEDMAGSISAFDPATGQETWRWRNDQPMCSSVLATAGDLVFAGAPSGEFYAFNARTGEFLWQFQCGSGHHSNPTTYSIDGRQYIAVPTGWGDRTERFLPRPSGRLERPCSTSSRYRISVVRLRLQRAVEWCPIVAAKLVGEGYGPPHGRVCLLRTSGADAAGVSHQGTWARCSRSGRSSSHLRDGPPRT